MDLGRVEDRFFEQVLGEDARAVEDAVIAGVRVGEASLALVTERLATLFGISKGDALTILGVSRTKLSRNPAMDVDLLDRVGSALKLHARVAAMIGSDRAAHWLAEPNRHLSDKRPLDLMTTHLGRDRVEGLVTALEDGTFL